MRKTLWTALLATLTLIVVSALLAACAPAAAPNPTPVPPKPTAEVPYENPSARSTKSR